MSKNSICYRHCDRNVLFLNFYHRNCGPAKWSFKKADWNVFESYLENKFQQIKLTDMSVDKLYNLFCKETLEAAKLAIPKGSRTEAAPWWTNEIESAVQQRRKAATCANDGDHERKKWLEECDNVKILIQKAKSETWKNFVSKKVSNTSHITRVWQAIKKMDGQSIKNNEGRSMNVNGKCLSHNKDN